MKTVITTGGKPNDKSRLLAIKAADILGYEIVERNKRSVAFLQKEYESAVLVAGIDRYELYQIGMDKPFFFHPNSAAFRLKRLVNGEKDPLIEISQLKSGDSFLDCTLGLASDSIVASYITGNSGKVLGVEGNADIAFITSSGLKAFTSDSKELTSAMEKVHVVHSEAVSFLRNQPDKSWDIVYIDPMFSAPIEESSNFTILREIGLRDSLNDEWVNQALRVCKRLVVIKDHFNSPIFEKYKLKRQVRPNAKFHFGYISTE